MKNQALDVATEAALLAGKMILQKLKHIDQLEVTAKHSNEFVTQVDRLSEEMIIDLLQKAYPDYSILAEEGGRISGKNDDGYCWVIDPMDGTRNFMQGYSPFSVSIALMRNKVIELGVVYDPTRGDLFTAAREQGAYLNGIRIHVSPETTLKTGLIGTGFPLDKNSNNMVNYLKEFNHIFTQCADVRRDGCSSLDLAYVAAGRLNGFWEFGLRIWHVAAAALMIREAGGIVSDFEGGDNYLECGNIVAGNITIQKELLRLINK